MVCKKKKNQQAVKCNLKNQTKPTHTFAEEEQAGKHMFTILQSGQCTVQYMNLNKNHCSFVFFFFCLKKRFSPTSEIESEFVRQGTFCFLFA